MQITVQSVGTFNNSTLLINIKLNFVDKCYSLSTRLATRSALNNYMTYVTMH